MTPFYFGSRGRRLFGVYHPAQGGGGSRAALLCYPWGHEYVNAHRSLVRLANLLSQSGFHVLRFDYYGTGDSGGEDHEATLEGARQDIAAAIEELRDLTGVERVSLVGLRLGAALAMEAAHDQPAIVQSLVLWDPVIKGAEYLRELYSMDDSMRIPGVGPAEKIGAERGGGREVMGLPLTEKVAAELTALDLTAILPQLPFPMLSVAIRPVPGSEDVRALLEPRDNGSAVELIDDQPAWHEDWPENVGVIPVSVLNRIVQWMN